MTGTLARQASTAAAAYQPLDEGNVPADVHQWRMICEQATLLAKAQDLIPKAYQGRPEAIMAAGLAGQPFGWNVMTAMRMGHVINGGYRLNAETQAALIRQAGHRIVIERGAQTATVVGTRRDDGTSYTATWDETRARAVPVTEWTGEQGSRRKVESNLWDKWAKAGTTDYMLVWRAISEVARFLFPDLMYGMAYAAGERDDVDELEPLPEVALAEPTIVGSSPAITVEVTAPEQAPEPEQQTDLFGHPTDLPNTTPPWTDWGRAEWANHCAGRLSLPEIGREWKIKNFDGVATAEDRIRAAIYDAAGPQR